MPKLSSIYSLVCALCVLLFVYTRSDRGNRSPEGKLEIINQFPNEGGDEKRFRTNILSEWSPSVETPLVTVVCSGAVSKLDKPSVEKIYVDLKRQREQIRVMLGSLLYFSRSKKWVVYIVTDTQATFDIITDGLHKHWPKSQYERLKLRRRSIKMPKDKKTNDLLYHYRPCAWQKLFLELVFPEYGSLVFTDSDVLFTGPAENLWKEFEKFNSTQAIGASPEPWYLKDDNWPYAGKIGINTGALTLNLTRLRNLPLGGLGYATAKELKTLKDNPFEPRHDQDMVNILLRKYPHFLHEMEYKWNFIPSDCSQYALPCESCASEGITIVHGADAVFYRNVDQRYRILYAVMEKMTMDLKMTPKELLLYYQGGMDGLKAFQYPETICSAFDKFFNYTSISMQKMASETTMDFPRDN